MERGLPGVRSVRAVQLVEKRLKHGVEHVPTLHPVMEGNAVLGWKKKF